MDTWAAYFQEVYSNSTFPPFFLQIPSKFLPQKFINLDKASHAPNVLQKSQNELRSKIETTNSDKEVPKFGFN